MAKSDFWARVDKNGPIVRPELGPCWIWTGSKNRGGYGQVRFRGKMARAHVVAFILTNGRLSKPCVLHRCDNRSCCRPDHLFEGTHKDNSDDKIAKGRGLAGRKLGRLPAMARTGAKNGKYRLLPDVVADIRASAPAMSGSELAAKYGISKGYANKIAAGTARAKKEVDI